MKQLYTMLENFQPKFSFDLYKTILLTFPAVAVVLPLCLVAMPHLEFFNDMARQPKGKAQMMYGNYFGDKIEVSRASVEGTIPRNYQHYPLAGLSRPQIKEQKLQYLKNTAKVNMDVLKRGQNRYETFCIACHGKSGFGDGEVAKRGYPAPTTFHSDTVRKMEDGEIYHVITHGGEAAMPSYKDKLSPQDRWAVIHYVRVLQRAYEPKKEGQ